MNRLDKMVLAGCVVLLVVGIVSMLRSTRPEVASIEVTHDLSTGKITVENGKAPREVIPDAVAVIPDSPPEGHEARLPHAQPGTSWVEETLDMDLDWGEIPLDFERDRPLEERHFLYLLQWGEGSASGESSTDVWRRVTADPSWQIASQDLRRMSAAGCALWAYRIVELGRFNEVADGVWAQASRKMYVAACAHKGGNPAWQASCGQP